MTKFDEERVNWNWPAISAARHEEPILSTGKPRLGSASENFDF